MHPCTILRLADILVVRPPSAIEQSPQLDHRTKHVLVPFGSREAANISAALEKASTAAPDVDDDEPEKSAPPVKLVEMRRPEQSPKRVGRQDQPVVQVSRFAQPQNTAPAIAQQFGEKFDQEKRMLLTRSESMALDRLVASLAMRLNTQVKLSHVLRALVSLLLNAENELDQRAGDAIGLIRPPNGDAKALQRFEREIARVLAAAIRDAGPLR